MLAICTEYRRNEDTFAALEVARRAEILNLDFKMYHINWRASLIDTYFDAHIKPFNLKEIKDKADKIIWTTPPTFNSMTILKTKQNILRTSSDKLMNCDLDALLMMDMILTPTPTQHKVVKNNLQNIQLKLIQYDCGLPITKRVYSNLDNDKLIIFLSIFGNMAGRLDIEVLDALLHVAIRTRKAVIQVAYTNGLNIKTAKRLKVYARKYPDCFKIFKSNTWRQHKLIMYQSDLVVWPVKWDSLCVTGLTALHMGIPVIGWNIPPINEVCIKDKNSLLISCPYGTSYSLITVAKPDYKRFNKILTDIINKNEIGNLYQATHETLTQRKLIQDDLWRIVLES